MNLWWQLKLKSIYILYSTKYLFKELSISIAINIFQVTALLIYKKQLGGLNTAFKIILPIEFVIKSYM